MDRQTQTIKIWITVLFLAATVITTPSYANELFGEGRGVSEDEAKKAALADLSSTIQVEVRSEFSSVQTTGQIHPYAERVIQTRSELPIFTS